MKKQFLTLALLLPLAGCWDSGCCKKNTEVAPVGQQATPTERCTHAGCTHDHGHDAHHAHHEGHHEGHHAHHEGHHEGHHEQELHENNQYDEADDFEMDEK